MLTVYRFLFFTLLLSTAFPTTAQMVIRNCTRVAGDTVGIYDNLLLIEPSGTFNNGEVHYFGESRLTNHGGFSELAASACSALLGTGCTMENP